MTDTLLLNPNDSLITLFQDEDDIYAKYRLASAYLDEDDYYNALSMINDIPGEFTLNSFQNKVYNAYEDYFDILQHMNSQNMSAKTLDSLKIQELHRIKDLELPLISSYSRGQLVKGGHINYTETVFFPDNTKSSRVFENDKNHFQKEKDYLLKLFPNPAGDYVILYYDLIDYNTNVRICIIDASGKEMDSFMIDCSENQMTINISRLQNGIYYLSLFLDNNLKETHKFVKGRY